MPIHIELESKASIRAEGVFAEDPRTFHKRIHIALGEGKNFYELPSGEVINIRAIQRITTASA